jgi:hypothetical protein
MTPRNVAIQGGLAFVALVLAYTTWQRTPELQQGEVFVIDSTSNDLEKVRYEDTEGKSWNEIAKAKDADGTFIAVRMSGYDNSGLAIPAGHPGIALKQAERLVRGNETANKLFERFAPLRANRALGVLDPGMLKDLGLDKPKQFIEVTTRGVKRRFAVVPAPPGGAEPYLQDQVDKKVYIVPRPVYTDLRSASSVLLERRLHSFRVEEVDRITVEAGGKKRELIGSRIEDYPGIRLAYAETRDKPDPTLKNWQDKIFGAFPTEILGQGEVPAAGEPVVAVHVEYFSRGRKLGFVDLARGATSAVSTAAPAKADIYARSEFTLGWFRMAPDTQNLLTEGESLVSKK